MSWQIFVKARKHGPVWYLFTNQLFTLQTVLAELLPVAEQLLEKIQKEPSAVLRDEATVLHLILGKYNEYSAPLLHKDPKSLDIFLKAVHTTEELFTGMSSVQITALEKVSDFFQKREHTQAFKNL